MRSLRLLPWECWGIMDPPETQITEKDNARLDEVAAVTLADNRSFDALRELYARDEQLRVPSIIRSYPGGPEVLTVELAA